MKSLLQSTLNTRVLPTGDLWYIRSNFLLFAENDVECVALLQRMSNTRQATITLDVEMEDYHRIKGDLKDD